MKYSQEFLKELYQEHNRVVYARITALNFNEYPIESIEGRVTQGSITLAGNSSVRRTCNLTMVSEKTDVSSYVWSLNTKFRLEVGIENHVNINYPNIIWFNQGIFLINSCSIALSSNSFTITLQGKDKMCQLNGEIGGTFTSSVDFGKYEQVDDQGNVTYIPQLIKDIIREMVHTYGNEPFHNIIINDLEETALMMQEYRYKEPLFLLRQANDLSGEYERALLGGEQMCKFTNSFGVETYCLLKELPVYDTLATTFGTDQQPSTRFQLTQDYSNYANSNDLPLYCATKIEMGQVVGFIPTELTYTGDLIANVGETVVAVLDKIKNMLGDFEYFYNEEGQFIFQRQKTYINTAWTPTIYNDENNQTSVINAEETSYTYSFLGNELLTAFNNSPNLANLKNDYSVWGTRSTNGGSIPVHMRYAIHRKPKQYTTIQVEDEELIEYNKQYHLGLTGQNSITYIYQGSSYKYDTKQKVLYLTLENVYEGSVSKLLSLGCGFEYDSFTKTLKIKVNWDEAKKQNIVFCDWREIIYQMALDFRKYNHLDDFQLKIAKANPDIFPLGITGYEQYYIDMEGFWRQLYTQETQYDTNTTIKDNIQYYKKNVFYNPVITDETFNQSKDYEIFRHLNQNLLKPLDGETLEETIEKIKAQVDTIAATLDKYNYIIKDNQVLTTSQKHINGMKYYHNVSAGTSALPKYEPVKLSEITYDENGEKQYIYSPVKSDTTVAGELFTQESSYDIMTPQELDQLVLFPGGNLKSLFIIKDCGTKKDIQTNDKYYTIRELGLNDSASEIYSKKLYDIVDEKTTIEEIVLAPVQEPGNIYYIIELVSDLSLLDEKTQLYTKTPYLLYKQESLKDSNNEQNHPYYNVKYCDSIEEASYSDQTYYEFQGKYIDPKPTNLTVLERKDERIMTFYNNLNTLLSYYSVPGKNALFTLTKEQMEQLTWAIKKLLYIQYIMPQVTVTPKLDGMSEDQCPETFESEEKPENIEGNPFEKDYNQFLETYYLFLEELNQKFDNMNNDFDSYDYKAFMSEQEFIQFYEDFTLFITQTIENVQLICQLYSPGKDLTVKQNIGFDEFLYGPLIEQIQYNVKYLYVYPENKIIEKKLHQANQLDHKVLLSLKEIANKISSFEGRINTLQSYLNSYEFVVKDFYGEALILDKNHFNNYFYLEPAMCYSLSKDYYWDLNERRYWNKNVYESPELLNFWIDFLDTEGELGKFSVQNIGPRQKASNDNSVKSIYYRNAPLVIFTTPGTERNQTGYRYIETIEGLPEDMYTYKIMANSAGKPYAEATDIPVGSLGRSEYKIVDSYDKKSYNYWRYEEINDTFGVQKVWRGQEYDGIYSQLFVSSGQGKSAKDAIDTLLYTHSYCIESTSITTVPVYHLQPNTRIYIYDNNTNIEGEYIISQLTVPLAYNGTMNLSATKAIDRII